MVDSAELEVPSRATARRRRRRRAGRTLDLREAAGVALLTAAIVGSALAFGAQRTWPLVLSALASAGAALLMPPARAPRSAWFVGLLAGYTMLQLVPLPLGVLAHLSPAAAAVWRGALSPLHRSVHWATLSVDPAATALEALKWSAYVCVLVAASGWRARRRAVMPALLVVGSALVIAVVTLVHGLFDVKRVYGLYEPYENWRWIRGPFINGNNLAGYLNLGFFAGAGIWFSGRSEKLARPLAFTIPLLGVGALLAASRGGTVALVVGGFLFAALLVHQRPGRRPALALTLGGTALVVLGLGVAGAGDRTWEVVGNADLGVKARAWHWVLPMVGDFPWFGSGRGAFETAFLPYRQPLERNFTLVFAQAENFPLQWIADWGIPVGVLALVGLVVFGRRALGRARRDPLAAGLFAGIVALLLQNLADLALEVFAVTAAALVAFAAVDSAVEEPSLRTLRPALPGALAVVAWSVLILLTGANPVQSDRRQTAHAYAALATNPGAGPAFDAGLQKLLLRHPGEAYFPLLGAYRARKIGRDPLPWLSRALERSPLDANTHLLLSDVLAQRGARQQSLLHSRLAAVYDGLLRERAIAQIAAHVRSIDDLRSAFPAELPGSELLEQACDQLQPGVLVECWREATTRGAGTSARVGLAGALLRAIEGATPPCGPGERAHCEEEASAELSLLEQSHDPPGKVAELRALLLSSRGENANAAKLLSARCPAGAEGVACLTRAFELAVRGKDPLTLGDVVERYASVVCGDANACAALRERAGRSFLDLGAPGLALRQFTAATEVNPNAERWLLVAEAGTRVGALSAARHALDQAQREPETSVAQRERIAAVARALAGAADGGG